MTELAERLGHGADARLVIINCDDLGASHAANAGVTSRCATAWPPAPRSWSRRPGPARPRRYRGEDVGVHLTLNAEYDRYRWGPITRAPSLLDGDGGFPRTIEDLWDHADLDEVRRELRAQVERAILWGFDVSHLDSHMGALQLRPEFFDIYLDLALEFGLPSGCRAPRPSGPSGSRSGGSPPRRGSCSPTTFVLHVGSRRASSARARPAARRHRALRPPRPRHARAAGLRRRLAARVDDHHLLCFDTELPVMLQRAGVSSSATDPPRPPAAPLTGGPISRRVGASGRQPRTRGSSVSGRKASTRPRPATLPPLHEGLVERVSPCSTRRRPCTRVR